MSLTLTGAGSGSEVVTVLTGYQTAVLADSPVRYWKLDETSGTNAVDTMGNGNGTYNGVTLNQAPATASGASIDTSTGGYMTATGPLLAFPLTTWMIEAWVKKSAIVTGATIFIERTGSNLGLIGLVINASGFLTMNYRNDAGTLDGYAASSGNVADNNWHHVAARMNGTAVTFFVDGLSVGTGVRTVGTAMTTNELRWGQDTAGTQSWNGGLDHLALYTTAPADARVLAHFNARNT